MKGFLKFIAFGLLFVVLFFGGYRACRYTSRPASGAYWVAMDPSWFPLTLYGKESAVTAFSSDVLFASANREKIKVELVRSSPKQLLELLDDGQVQGILAGYRKDQLPPDKYLFSKPYYRVGAVLVLRKNVPFSSIEDLPGKRIGVKRNSPILFRVHIDPRVTIVPYDSQVIALEQLSKGQMDGVIMDQLLAYLYFSGMHQTDFRAVPIPMTMEGLFLLTLDNKEGSRLIDRFNKGVDKIKADGAYGRFLSQWDLIDPDELIVEDQS